MALPLVKNCFEYLLLFEAVTYILIWSHYAAIPLAINLLSKEFCHLYELCNPLLGYCLLSLKGMLRNRSSANNNLGIFEKRYPPCRRTIPLEKR